MRRGSRERWLERNRGRDEDNRGRLLPPCPRTAQASGLAWLCHSLAAAREAQEAAPAAVAGAGRVATGYPKREGEEREREKGGDVDDDGDFGDENDGKRC